MHLSTKVVPSRTGMTNFLATPNLPRVRDSLIRWWTVTVPDTLDVVPDTLRMSGIFPWRILSTQLGSKRWFQ